MSEVTNLNDSNFEQEINDKEIAVVDFWAEWCAPCKMFEPIFEEFKKENPDIYCARVNVDEAQETANKFNIRSIPTTIFFKKGKVVKMEIGLLPSTDIIKKTIEEIK
jgi:thioredoxin 1